MKVLHYRLKWRQRDSNPRPNKEPICFLHAYLGLRFRAIARPKPPTIGLSAKVSNPHRSLRILFRVFPRRLVLSARELGLERRLVQAPCTRIMRSTILRLRSESYSIVASYSLRMIFTSVSSKLGVLTYSIYLLSKPDSPDHGRNNPISGAKVIKAKLKLHTFYTFVHF